MSKITAEEVARAMNGSNAKKPQTLTDSLNDPAIRRLVVEACVNEARHSDVKFAVADFEWKDMLTLVLCPTTETPE